ncbi:SGNH/GDSL hydrolase family protein [Sanguibacter sp. HDW7]|uniref:SGNH/GDSL hydrolase family protein n=1 Tax=Sanguibacter sp. HDW7 TaxID=2714931 RepID=UPI001409AA1A|nr:SGNH/GDSL hydrolase family protein [Sanguibacter sp. HDW7]QIK82786.1 lipase [Sanguibacter sp. HDW7]
MSHTVPLTLEHVRGALRLEPTARGVAPHRLPAWALAQAADPQLSMVEAQGAGVRIALRTAATSVTLTAHRTRVTYAGAPARPDGSIDLVVDGEVVARRRTSGGTTTELDMATGIPTLIPGDDLVVTFDGLPAYAKDVEIWLPFNETVEIVEVSANAPVEPPASAGRRWLHHGSSISQGSNAARPTGTWAAVAARRGGVELQNLGFGGAALLDPFVARTMRDTPADLISVSLGINLINSDLMRLRAFRAGMHGFLDTIRDGHPTTPLLVVTPLHCAIHEATPGPGAFDTEALAEGRLAFKAVGDPAEVPAGRLTLETIRAETTRLVTERQAGDPHLFLLDGLTLYGAADEAAHPLRDSLHPDADTHRFVGDRFAHAVFAEGPFAG